jgi:hypothetical protein
MVKSLIDCWRLTGSSHLGMATVVILLTIVFTSCASKWGEMNPVYVSGNCEKGTSQDNTCITMDITTPNNHTGVCSQMGYLGWVYRANKYLVASRAKGSRPEYRVYPRTGSPSIQETCAPQPLYKAESSHKSDRIIEGEYALTSSGIRHQFMTVYGDICSSRPRINFHRFAGDGLLLKHLTPKHIRYQERKAEPGRHTDPTYSFYVGPHNAKWAQDNGFQESLVMVKEIINKQCHVVPDEVRIVGQFTPPPKRKSKAWGFEGYTSDKIYGGTYYPNAPGFKVIHDDKEMAKAVYDLALAHHERHSTRVLAAQRKLQERRRKAKIGGALIFGTFLGIYQASPCNDPNLPDADKPAYCH